MEPLEVWQKVCPYCGFNNSYPQPPDALSTGSILKGKYLVGIVSDLNGFGYTYIGLDLAAREKAVIREFFPGGFSRRSPETGKVVIYGHDDYPIEDLRKERDRYITMAKMQKEIISPFIAPVKDCFFENNTLYIVRNLVDGVSFRNEMQKSGGKLHWKRVLRLMMPLLPEIEKIHKKGVFDIRIRPGNLLFYEYNSRGMNSEKIVLTDLGFFHVYYDPDGDYFLRASFTEPIEMFVSKASRGPYTDVYSICALMYFAITGEKPSFSVDRMIDGGELKFFSSFGLNVPEAVEKAVRHGLEIKSADRTRTMMELYNELSSALKFDPAVNS